MVTRFLNQFQHKYFHPFNIKIDLSDHPFIKDDIFEVNVYFPTRGTPIGIVTKYYEHHNMSHISHSTNNNQQNHYIQEINRTNFCILRIFIKEPTTAQQVLQYTLSQKLTGKYNRVLIVTARRYKNIFRKIFNKIDLYSIK